MTTTNKISLESNLTVTRLMQLGSESIQIGLAALSHGERSITRSYAMPLYKSPILVQLSYSVKQVTAAHSALQSWMAKNGSESGLTPLKKLSLHSHGWWACFNLLEEAEILGVLAVIAERTY